ncbi:acyl-CoA dehydrogenase family protein [Nocardioides cavernaquae]|uniref:Acyl-CoA dehydrogenase n=1 Tax=Nocardioides cavernaquae TaxID=2321396 RepID=A0A3A5H843_9ACTN|nr:acyl-CoA dehydrogenase family protein [Nocardioides cavernaquae]RJS46038.1 acyl-CoA dehydrogenase [Nocardioides cavernaquae]
MIRLEAPRKFDPLVNQAHQVAMNLLRPISRKYDLREHDYPVELDMLASMIDGLTSSGQGEGAGAAGVRRGGDDRDKDVNKNGSNMSSALSVMEMCWGDAGLMLTMPRQGLGNSAIASVATDEQLEKFRGAWAAMAITEPDTGSDTASIRTTATLDGDSYVINGQKIFVTCGDRADVVVVWATLDRALGRAAIKSFVVPKDSPGLTLIRLEKKLGVRVSDTAVLQFDDVRVPAENLLGSPEVNVEQGFAGVMATFDNTRPLVGAMSCGIARAALEYTRDLLAEQGIVVDYVKSPWSQHAAAATLLRLEADYEASYLLVLESAWMADNRRPNSLEASMAKAKAGTTVTETTQKCVELCTSLGYSETELLEKWARDSKIFDIFEGTQQIQQLIMARRLLGKTSSELR